MQRNLKQFNAIARRTREHNLVLMDFLELVPYVTVNGEQEKKRKKALRLVGDIVRN